MNEPQTTRAAREIAARRETLAAAVTDRHYQKNPGLLARWGPAGRLRCLEDAGYHLAYLSEALAAAAPPLFIEYVGWAKAMLAGRGIGEADLAANLDILCEVLERELEPELAAPALSYIETARDHLPDLPSDPPSALGAGPLAELAERYVETLLAGDRRGAGGLVMAAVAAGTPLKDVYLHVFQRAQHEVGRLWQVNRLSVAQEHFCTAATQLIMSQLYPLLFATERNGHTLVATCVSGDLHEIGVRMISDFFEMDGWDTFYLGANTPTASVVRTLADRNADVLAVSATMSFHLREVEALIQAVRQAPELRRVKVLVGGRPFNTVPGLWQKIGADGWARDAEESLRVARQLVAPAGETAP